MPHTVSDTRQFSVNPDDYELLEDIGQGVSATVYRAIYKPFNETVAIKSLDLEKCNSSLDDIRKEAQMMSMIYHPNVVRAFCSFVKDQHLWVIMPYMAGGSFLHIMKSHYADGLEEAVIATVLRETLKALEYLHRHGHIHRDVKAGNILLDQNGNVKLGDFGVSACMFDMGDRQRARNTFCGTPCWMAPEVMEQLHGYDFKADIWSFGITALELAHGHAPFSKYPPMKVLLMTLQNAPPGLDYERDRKFSKAMKEMIAMCLVKDPAKRPTADKLLKHSFFKQAKGPEFITKAILDGLPNLAERVKSVKAIDEAKISQQKLPSNIKEEISQHEYKRGVSDWNFNLEDLKRQAALIPDDDSVLMIPATVQEEDEKLPRAGSSRRDSDSEISDVSSEKEKEREKTPMKEKEERRQSPQPLAGLSSSSSKPGNMPKAQPSSQGRKETKHIGRFEVFEGDQDDDSDTGKGSDSREKDKERLRSTGPSLTDRSIGGSRSSSRLAADDRPSLPERTSAAVRSMPRLGDEESNQREHRSSAKSGPLDRGGNEILRSAEDSSHRGRDKQALQPPAQPTSATGPQNGPLAANGGQARAGAQGTKESSDEKAKGGVGAVAEKGHEKVQRKGRFSVITESDNTSEDVPLPKRITSTSHLNEKGGTGSAHHSQPTTPHGLQNVPVAAIVPHLQTLMKHAADQQDVIYHIINTLMPTESGRSGLSRVHELGVDLPSERERELLQQVVELQSRITNMDGELHTLKMRNSQLERQLNVFFNKEEEERIRKEEAAQDDG